MREVKFRAWDTFKKNMFTPSSVANGVARVIRRCNIDDPVIKGSDGCNYYKDWDVEQAVINSILMQYTGLNDCEGTEIYEGDVIEDDEHYYSVVSWDENDFMFVASDFGALCDYNGTKIKVIGNIHQNPELIK